VQAAYDILSDPKERRWYDEHRDDLLRGGDGTKKKNGEDGDDNAYVYDVMPMFHPDAFEDFDDEEDGFFAIYREAFEEIDQMERVTFERETGTDYVDPDTGESGRDAAAPSFGSSDEDYDQVGDFYRRWESFR